MQRILSLFLAVAAVLALAAPSQAFGRRCHGGCHGGGCSQGGCSQGGCSQGGCSQGGCSSGQCGQQAFYQYPQYGQQCPCGPGGCSQGQCVQGCPCPANNTRSAPYTANLPAPAGKTLAAPGTAVKVNGLWYLVGEDGVAFFCPACNQAPPRKVFTTKAGTPVDQIAELLHQPRSVIEDLAAKLPPGANIDDLAQELADHINDVVPPNPGPPGPPPDTSRRPRG